MIGSPGFMSPEQAAGYDVGPPSDIFSLGAVLAFAATGQGPFGTGTTAALLYRVVHGFPSLDQVPPEARPLIERCLAKDPRQRPTAAGLLADVGALQPNTNWLPAFTGHTPTPTPSPAALTSSPTASTSGGRGAPGVSGSASSSSPASRSASSSASAAASSSQGTSQSANASASASARTSQSASASASPSHRSSASPSPTPTSASASPTSAAPTPTPTTSAPTSAPPSTPASSAAAASTRPPRRAQQRPHPLLRNCRRREVPLRRTRCNDILRASPGSTQTTSASSAAQGPDDPSRRCQVWIATVATR